MSFAITECVQPLHSICIEISVSSGGSISTQNGVTGSAQLSSHCFEFRGLTTAELGKPIRLSQLTR